jgi:hypothetical protein
MAPSSLVELVQPVVQAQHSGLSAVRSACPSVAQWPIALPTCAAHKFGPSGPFAIRADAVLTRRLSPSPWTSTPPPVARAKKVLEGREGRRRHSLGVRIPGPIPPAAPMDQRKALFRAKLREAKEKQEKRIDPSLVRSPPFPSLSPSRLPARVLPPEPGSSRLLGFHGRDGLCWGARSPDVTLASKMGAGSRRGRQGFGA